MLSSWMGEGLSKPFLVDAHEQLAFEEIVFELIALRC